MDAVAPRTASPVPPAAPLRVVAPPPPVESGPAPAARNTAAPAAGSLGAALVEPSGTDPAGEAGGTPPLPASVQREQLTPPAPPLLSRDEMVALLNAAVTGAVPVRRTS